MTEYRVYEAVVYEAFEDNDKQEGKGTQTSLGFFLFKETAELAAEGKGVQGSIGPIRKATKFICEVVSSGEMYIIGDKINNELSSNFAKKRAMAKLSDEDKKVLGLK